MTLRMLFVETILLAVLVPDNPGFAQEVVLDFDGNQYQSIVIGTQVWLQENLKSLHYSDGSEIPEVVAYNNSETNANIYGRLYTWDAAMGGSLVEEAQGICPEGWHIPSDAEWGVLENYLGGAAVAGGKLKQAGMDNWSRFNTGADNASGFTALPGGEYDAHDSPHQFRLIHDYAVFWTSTETSVERATERYLAYNSAASSSLDWYKIMKYSVRAIKDASASTLGENQVHNPNAPTLFANTPNPFNPSTTIHFEVGLNHKVLIRVYDIRGKLVRSLFENQIQAGAHNISWNGLDESGQALESGIYMIVLRADDQFRSQKVSLIR